jgi:CheY-like chemotaxis protein
VEKPFVLLADDNEATCTLIKALLHREFEVDVATDGSEAIKKLKSRHYAAVLLDLVMPVTDGVGVLEFLAAERPELLPCTLVVTAAVSSRQLDRLRDYPIACVITKPFEVDQLLSAVKRVAGDCDATDLRGTLLSSGMILLLADFLQRKLMV